MTKRVVRSYRFGSGASLLALALLTACGGGGVNSTPTPSPAPAPPPTPAPPTTPPPSPPPSSSGYVTPPLPPDTIGYNDTEFRLSDGPEFHGAATAWEDGATGSGEVIAIVDTGIMSSESALAGRISPDSAGVVGNTTFEGVDDHGTIIAIVAAAANDSNGTVGIAYDATIMAIRADTPGTCGTPDDCSFGDIAEGIDWAVDHGATVINMSIGGAFATAAEEAAVIRAANAGIVVVISSGNEGEARPDPFPRSLANLGLGNVIIVGSVNGSGVASSFSNGALGRQQFYISAMGERVRIDTDSESFFISGTSFSAPQVSGAVALLAQAFPSLSATDIVDLLFETAQDVGDPGLDDLYGWGVLDIHEAFQPQGTTTLAGQSFSSLPLYDTSAVGSPAMGDALTTASFETIVLDKYDRAFNFNLGGTMRGSAIPRRLEAAVGGETRFLSMSTGRASMAFTVDRSGQGAGLDAASQLRLTREDAEQARVLAARVAMQLSPKSQFGFTYAEGPQGLVAIMQGQDRPAFLVSQDARGDDGIFRRTDLSLAFRRSIGPWGLTMSAESGQTITGNRLLLQGDSPNHRKHDAVRSVAFELDRRWGSLDSTIGLSWMNEERTVLGGRFHDAFGGGGANSVFLDAGARWTFADGWRLGGNFRNGWTFAGNGALIDGSSVLVSRAWSLDMERRGVLADNDRIAFRIAQPLRVEAGSLAFNVPVAFSYDSMSATYGLRHLTLSPDGRELLAELAWRTALFGGDATASVFYRREPGHYSHAPDDAGVAMRWSAEF